MTITEIRSALAGLGTRPRQVLGQNFLHDQNLAALIAGELAAGPDDTIVEIGPGLGALTEFLADRTGRLILLEKDALMVDWLRRRFSAPHVEIIHGDALDFDLRRLWGGGPVKVIGNLPYYVSTPLIARFSSAFSPASMLVLTLQSEVAERLAAGPDDDAYGAMSVCVQRRWRTRLLRKLPPSVFYPEPKVGSATVVMEQRERNALIPLDDTVFETLVRRGFGERRKQLRGLLSELRDRWPEICRGLDVPETVRAEDLALPQWETLTRIVAPVSAQKDSELFDEVDENDRVIGPKPRGFIHVNNLRHRAIHIELFNSRGELFLQRRSPWKDLNPSKWDSSAAGHVDAGETYAEAASRELGEELGVEAPLERIGALPCTRETSWEFVEVFRGRHEGPFRFAGLEVETGGFFPIDRIARWVEARPEEFSPLFRMIFPRFIFESCVGTQPRYE